MIMTCYGFEDSNNIFDVSVNGKIAQNDCMIMGGDDTDPTILEVDIKASVKDGKNEFQVNILDGDVGLCFIKLELVLKNCIAVPDEKIPMTLNGPVEYVNQKEVNARVGGQADKIDVFLDTIYPNIEAFWEEYDNKRPERDPKILAIDEDFYEGFLGEDRD